MILIKKTIGALYSWPRSARGRWSLPKDLGEFGMTKIVAIDVLTKDDLAICDLGDRQRRRAYCR
jgi:hypothetical protein